MQPSEDPKMQRSIDDKNREQHLQREMPQQMLRRLTIENVKKYTDISGSSGGSVSPLSLDDVLLRAQAQVDATRTTREEMLELLEKIRSAGGITLEIYQDERLGYRMRDTLRRAVNAHWWGSNLVHNCEAEDRVGMRAFDEINEAFPNDGFLEDQRVFERFGHSLGLESYKKEEGTLFYLSFDSAENISSFRIFHQGHRNSLQVETYTAEQLISYLTTKSTEEIPEVKDLIPHFTLTADEYLQHVARFNKHIGRGALRLSLCEDDHVNKNGLQNSYLIADFLNIAPKQLGELLVRLHIGEELRLGSSTYFILGTSEQGTQFFVDLIPRRSSNGGSDDRVDDCELDEADSTGIVFLHQPELVIEIVTEYLNSRLDAGA